MAHTTGTRARVQRLTALVAIVLVAVAVGFAFGRVFEGQGAAYRMVAVGIASGVAAWALERRGLVLATGVSAALLLVVVAIAVFPSSTWFGAPTMQTLHQIARAATIVGEEARTKVSPAPPGDAALMLAAITAVWAAVFSCYALAFRAGSPLLSLVPPIALVAFADSVLDSFRKPQYGVLFLLAAFALIFADSLRRIQGWGPVWSPPGTHNSLLPSAGRSARRIGAGALVVASLAPLLVPGFGGKGVFDISRFNSSSRLAISPLVRIGALLQDNAQEITVFQIKTSEPSYWRMTALGHFDPTTAQFEQIGEPGIDVDGNAPFQVEGPGAKVAQDVTIRADLAGFPYLVAAATPYQISVDAHWQPAAEALSTTDTAPLDQDASYEVTSTLTSVSAGQLRQALPPPPTEFEPYPQGMPLEIQRTAEAWTHGKTTEFDKVLAIQDRLRTWTYDTAVSYQSNPQGIVDFLHKERGFCQQFATAMAVLLRSINIPARVVVGFTPGSDLGHPGTFDVTTKSIHSWVEVNFGSQYGWLGFEPTPGTGFGDPATASYEDIKVPTTCPKGPSGCTPTGGPTQPTPTPPPTTGRTKGRVNLPHGAGSAPSLGNGGGRNATGLHRLTAPIVFGLLVVLAGVFALAIPLGRWTSRRRRMRRAGREPRELILATYDLFGERAADLGLGREPGETPLEYRRRVEATGWIRVGDLERMTGAVVRAAYGPEPPSADDAIDVAADASRAIRDLRQATPLRRKILGIYRRD